MANTTNSTYMSLPIPVVGRDAGPQYATDLNSCLTLVDAHTHAPGSGTQITPAGLNINSDLTFASNSATNLKEAAFTSQSGALTGTNFLSFVSGNLYVNDGSGNQIPITSAGGVAGSPGSIGSLAAPASATYTAGSKLFTWLADSSKSAAMDNGAVTIRETNVASAKGVTLQSATSLAADYSLTLPAALPASTQYMTSSNTGALSFSTSNTIAAARTRATGTTVAAGGVAISTSCGTFSTNALADVDVTNLTVTITTSGRPIMLQLIPDGDTTTGSFLHTTASSNVIGSEGVILILRDGSIISRADMSTGAAVATGRYEMTLPPGAISLIDPQAAGTYTYKIQASVASSAITIFFYNMKLTAYEL